MSIFNGKLINPETLVARFQQLVNSVPIKTGGKSKREFGCGKPGSIGKTKIIDALRQSGHSMSDINAFIATLPTDKKGNVIPITSTELISLFNKRAVEPKGDESELKEDIEEVLGDLKPVDRDDKEAEIAIAEMVAKSDKQQATDKLHDMLQTQYNIKLADVKTIKPLFKAYFNADTQEEKDAVLERFKPELLQMKEINDADDLTGRKKRSISTDSINKVFSALEASKIKLKMRAHAKQDKSTAVGDLVAKKGPKGALILKEPGRGKGVKKMPKVKIITPSHQAQSC